MIERVDFSPRRHPLSFFAKPVFPFTGHALLRVRCAREQRERSMAAHVRFLDPATLAKPPGYSYVVETTGPGRTIYFAGQLGLDSDNKLLGAPGDFRSQCIGAFENLGKALAAVGAGFADLVKINNYLVDMSHVGIFREVRDNYLNTAAPPASTTVAISQLARPGALFEMEAIAVLPAKPVSVPRPKASGARRADRPRRTKTAGPKPKASARKRK
jgi:enamine deaminase RidA (YjgF/YER057c/UK114 family)